MTQATLNPAPAGAIAQEDRTLAMFTHLSGLAGYVVPFGGIVVPIVIWVVKSDNRTISAIAKQAVFLNIAVFLFGLALILPALTVILIPLAILGWVLLAIVALVLPIVGAVKASDGEYYAYPLVGSRP